MPYLRRSVLLLTISASVLLITIHILHFSAPRMVEPLYPVMSKEEAEKSYKYLKEYEHPKQEVAVPNPDYAARIAYSDEKPAPPKADDVFIPSPEDAAKMAYGGVDPKPKVDSKVPPANATAWHQDKNMWKVADAVQG